MAKIKLAAPLAGLRGTLAGVVYSANSSGLYARAWTMPVNPATQAQNTQRGLLSMFPSLWSALTEIQRDDWRTYATTPAQALIDSLGTAFYASGYNWFVRINSHLHAGATAFRDDPPSLVRPAIPSVTSHQVLDASSGPMGTTQIGFPHNEFLGYLVWISLSFRTLEGSKTQKRQYRTVNCKAPDYTTLSYFGPRMREIFGYPTSPWAYYLHISRQDAHGQRSYPIVKTGTVTHVP